MMTTIATSEESKTMTEEQKVLAVIENMTSAFQNKKIDDVMNSYEETAAIVFEPNAAITDSDTIKQMFQGAFMMNPEFTYDGHQVFVAGDTALHISPWNMAGKTPDGQVIEQSGLSVAVLRKQLNGEWLMVIDNPHGSELLNK
ncbi:MAG: DUF4440 domain-containing protein [Hyphomicrobiales bacterium]